MSKRKIENISNNKNIVKIEKVFVIDNHIYFNGLIDNQNLLLLKSKINEYILENGNTQNHTDTSLDLTNCIIIHINSSGGYVESLLNHLDIFSNRIKIVTVIENRVCDCGLLFSALSNKRYIKQQARVVIRIVSNNYWYLFKQCEIDKIDKFIEDLSNLFIKASKNRLSRERVKQLIMTSQELTPKKIKRLHLIDEII